MTTLLEAIRSERKGVALKEGPTARIRMAFLAGEQLGRDDLKRFGASSTSMIHMAMNDLKRVGYKFDSGTVASSKRGVPPNVVHWVTNPKHVPRTDSGSTRKFHPRKTKKPAVASETAAPKKPNTASQVFPLGLMFKLVAAELSDDGAVNYRLSDGNGRILVAVQP